MVTWLPQYHDMGLIGDLRPFSNTEFGFAANCYFPFCIHHTLGNYVAAALFRGAHLVAFSPLTFIAKPIKWLQAVSHYKAWGTAAPNFAYGLAARKVSGSICPFEICRMVCFPSSTLPFFSHKFPVCSRPLRRNLRTWISPVSK